MDINFIWYIFVYSVLGWILEVSCCAVTQKQFHNRGFLTAPLIPSYGIAFGVLILVLPQLKWHSVLQFCVTLVVVAVRMGVADEFAKQMNKSAAFKSGYEGILSGNQKGVVIGIIIACIYYLAYLVVHPMIIAFTMLIPQTVKTGIVIAALILTAMDLTAVLHVVRTGKTERYIKRQESSAWQKASRRLTDFIWNRLQRAYPGFREMSGKEQESCRFAQGVCRDKLIWVFLSTAFLGDFIETVYCGLVDGKWMSRSSVLYGPFSFVWGAGAVLLTIVLQRLAGKNDRYVFAAGFVIGGVYEYSCSVLTEALFGTVFWDYSNMPLNIGGRTNAMFCFFWGSLAVIWVKEIYPRLSRRIEDLPHLPGKILTWAALLFMLCNAALTAAAMARYGTRTLQPAPSNQFEEFLDQHYTDEYMEHRWQNMKNGLDGVSYSYSHFSNGIVSPIPEEQWNS